MRKCKSRIRQGISYLGGSVMLCVVGLSASASVAQAAYQSSAATRTQRVGMITAAAATRACGYENKSDHQRLEGFRTVVVSSAEKTVVVGSMLLKATKDERSCEVIFLHQGTGLLGWPAETSIKHQKLLSWAPAAWGDKPFANGDVLSREWHFWFGGQPPNWLALARAF
jgi:hypothetical protein